MNSKALIDYFCFKVKIKVSALLKNERLENSSTTVISEKCNSLFTRCLGYSDRRVFNPAIEVSFM